MKYPLTMEITCLNSGDIRRELIENKQDLELVLKTMQDATVRTPELMFKFKFV